MAASLNLVVDWWTLSYLEVTDVRKVLRGVLRALKPDGFFIVCLPVTLRAGNRGGPKDDGMHYRSYKEYESLFKEAGFVNHNGMLEAQHYEPGDIKGCFDYGREAVWTLTLPKESLVISK